MPIDAFKPRIDPLAREIRESPLAEGADRVYRPGELEWERRQRVLADRIMLPENVRNAVVELSRELGIEGPLPSEPQL